MTEPTEPPLHLAINAVTSRRTWCGRLVEQLDHVHKGDRDAVPPGRRVCRMCERARARHFRELA